MSMREAGMASSPSSHISTVAGMPYDPFSAVKLSVVVRLQVPILLTVNPTVRHGKCAGGNTMRFSLTSFLCPVDAAQARL
uniref:Uncharacterized protein n=1 Tax=Anguilla anguilla TaxID=7936 RepID=A0A0E9SUZ5_ANGAN